MLGTTPFFVLAQTEGCSQGYTHCAPCAGLLTPHNGLHRSNGWHKATCEAASGAAYNPDGENRTPKYPTVPMIGAQSWEPLKYGLFGFSTAMMAWCC